MSLPRTIIISSLAVFAVIGVVGGVKKISSNKSKEKNQVVATVVSSPKKKDTKASVVTTDKKPPLAKVVHKPIAGNDFPNVDRIFQLFTTGPMKLPIVETVTYASNVPWLKGRPAWIADYASYYGTSRHFIARSLNGKPDYFSQKVAGGSKFNVFVKNRPIEFHLLVDLSRSKMGFYYYDKTTGERVHLKTYKVGLGSADSSKVSGYLTPLGTYTLGNKVAIYKPGIMGLFQGKNVEMMRVFGTRWIPFDKEVCCCTEMAKGFGIQGIPWVEDPQTGDLVEQRDSIGKYEGDGCIRLTTEDVEEIFSIVISKEPTYIHIVRDFHDAALPGIEVASPKK